MLKDFWGKFLCLIGIHNDEPIGVYSSLAVPISMDRCKRCGRGFRIVSLYGWHETYTSKQVDKILKEYRRTK